MAKVVQDLNFMHGARAIAYIDDTVIGTIEEINFTRSGEENRAYVIGTRYIQAKEVSRFAVEGTIRTFIIDPEFDMLLALSDPMSIKRLEANGGVKNTITAGNVNTATKITNDNVNDNVVASFMPVFDIVILEETPLTETTKQDVKMVIRNCIIHTFDMNFINNTYVMSNVQFVGDNLERR